MSTWLSTKENRPFALALLTLIVLMSGFFAVKIIHTIFLTKYTGSPTPYEHQISFEGTGKAVGVPNIATVNVGVETKGKDLAGAQTENSEKNNALIEKFKELGIPKEDLKTTNYSVYPWSEWDPIANASKEKGWVISQQVEVKIRNLALVSKVIEVAGQNGSTNISGPNFTIDDSSALKTEAREKAIADAKAKAEALEKTLDIELDDLVGYYEFSQDPGMPYYAMKSMDSMSANEAAAPALETGSSEVSITVTLTYSMED